MWVFLWGVWGGWARAYRVCDQGHSWLCPAFVRGDVHAFALSLVVTLMCPCFLPNFPACGGVSPCCDVVVIMTVSLSMVVAVFV
ncbi:hypothetical protein JTE90_020086 [Oedothorax gibbosus]|uniref:Uncharacterized protein n=1 Tax=Oedothorax gibbosus TaxID=931172 RepID=A0AAV6TD74_9ARAC|nr:hypothetical protein JTE90_020086 [Oedothorax gibbosus]